MAAMACTKISTRSALLMLTGLILLAAPLISSGATGATDVTASSGGEFRCTTFAGVCCQVQQRD